jgi:TRAP-type C4-dicarboxylate transport system permease small subunit
MTASTALQVIGRYILTLPLPWTEELSRRMMSLLLFTASAVAYRSGGMVGIDILTDRFSKNMKIRVGILVNIVVIIFGVFVLWQGYILAIRNSMQISSALGISMMYFYMVIPVSGFLFIIFSIESILKHISVLWKTRKETSP